MTRGMDATETNGSPVDSGRHPRRCEPSGTRQDTTRRHVSVRIGAATRPEQSLDHTRVLVEIDDTRYVVGWGVNEFVVEPGHHRVTVCFRYCWGDRGRASCRICARHGSVVELAYRSPYFVFFSRGELVEDRADGHRSEQSLDLEA